MIALLLALALTSAEGVPSSMVAAPLRGVGIEQKLNAEIPLDLHMRDEHGASVTLRDYYKGKPVVLFFGYYTSPMLCPMTTSGLVRATRVMTMQPDRDFDVVFVSVNPADRPESAAAWRVEQLGRYGTSPAGQGWHLLTADTETVAALVEATGFHYRREEGTGDYAHAAGLILTTPEGRVSRYVFGLEFSPRELDAAIKDARENRIGDLVEAVMLYCFHYDPATGQYTVIVANLLRVFGVLTLLGMIGYIGGSFFREWLNAKRRVMATGVKQ